MILTTMNIIPENIRNHMQVGMLQTKYMEILSLLGPLFLAIATYTRWVQGLLLPSQIPSGTNIPHRGNS